MLRCVYMMLLGIPTSAFAVTLMKKPPVNLPVSFYSRKSLSHLMYFNSVPYCCFHVCGETKIVRGTFIVSLILMCNEYVLGLPSVLSVRPDPDYSSVKKDYSSSSIQSNYLSSSQIGSNLLFPVGSTKHWLVRMDKPGIGVVTKAQMVDCYAQILTKVLGK